MLFIFGGKENAKEVDIDSHKRINKLDSTEKHILFINGLMTKNAMNLSEKFSIIITNVIKDNYLQNESIQEIAYIVLSAINSSRFNITEYECNPRNLINRKNIKVI